MKNSVFRLYNEDYLGNIADHDVFIGGGIDTEFAKEKATEEFIKKGIENCKKERIKFGKTDALGMNRGIVAERYLMHKTINTAWGKKTTRKIEYQFMVHWEKKEICFMFREDM